MIGRVGYCLDQSCVVRKHRPIQNKPAKPSKQGKPRSAQSTLTKEMLEAVTRAGYLMEQRFVPVVEKFGFKVTPNQRYEDRSSGKAFELDLFAISGWQIGKRGRNFVFPVLLIACKNLRCPLVFFTHREIRMQWFLGQVQVSGLPFEIARRGETESIPEFLKVEEFHHYYRTGHVASQFCAVYEVASKGTVQKGAPKYEAGHTIGGRIELFKDFESLVRIIELEKRAHAASWRLLPEKEVINIQVYYPIFVTAGPVFECFVGKGRPRYRRVHQIGYLHRYGTHSNHRECRIDVVDEAGLRRLLELIENEGEEIEKRVGRHQRRFKENILRLSQDLMKQNIETQISWLSGDERREVAEQSEKTIRKDEKGRDPGHINIGS